VAISSPPGTPLKPYAPTPFETNLVSNRPRIRFSPDGKQLLLMVNAGRQGEEAWLLPYPSDGRTTPKQILGVLPPFGFTPTFHWLPDSRHIVMSLQVTPDAPRQLWLADTASGERHALTSGTTSKLTPSVAPDGTRVIFSEESGNYDVVSVDLATATPQTLIATERQDLMPAWAAAKEALVYVTDRSGPNEIWLHRPGLPDRPVVTARDFPSGPTQWFMAPALSPKADRVIYSRFEAGQGPRLWISSTAGGTPIQLTSDTAYEAPGSWSPDGGWFVYTARRNGKAALMKVKTSGQASPVVLKEGDFPPSVPAWSPTGDWIAYLGELISPDGKTTKPLGNRGSPHYMFSHDGTLVYGVTPENDRQVLFSIDTATGAEKVIGAFSSDFTPGSPLRPSIRFSLSPDGKSFAYGSGRFKSNLWMLEGFARPKCWFDRLLR
jgi:WD40 repeat protein